MEPVDTLEVAACNICHTTNRQITPEIIFFIVQGIILLVKMCPQINPFATRNPTLMGRLRLGLKLRRLARQYGVPYDDVVDNMVDYARTCNDEEITKILEYAKTRSESDYRVG